MSKLIHIFKPGTHQPMEGEPISFTLKDFEATVRAYNMDLHEAPLVVGHPKHNNPAYGWVKQMIATPEGLFIEPHQVDEAFAELVRSARFKKISPSFYEPDEPSNPVPGVYYLRHVGFLGAMPPAVKGLKAIEFADGGQGIVCFNENLNEDTNMADAANPTDKKGLLARLVAFLTKELGEEKAAEIITEEGAAAIQDAGADEILPEVAAQLVAVSEENQRLKAENEELLEQAEELEIDGESADFAEVIRRKVKPSHRAAVRAMLKAASKKRGTSKLEFSEGGKNKPLTPALQAFIRSLPDVVDFSEVARKSSAPKKHLC
ncbi:peptidase [Limnobaculum zhutongyuii]|uniref:Peptidase n=1 Tax=Limnobaculum zhutongyuii TaxID=2498113 RepID=A0A411WI62_9GAMM|nr:peptidase [Limnobaculum zhutongyuii]QBH95767.1 peptidase [Limnobaculum zhutongyuii]